MVFRSAGDIGNKRTAPTPNAEIISENLILIKFIVRWNELTHLTDTTVKELTNFKKHTACLSNIPPSIGTN